MFDWDSANPLGFSEGDHNALLGNSFPSLVSFSGKIQLALKNDPSGRRALSHVISFATS